MKPAQGPSQRQLRAGELIRHALADIFIRGETGDPVLEKMGVSVLEVAMSPDLKIATAYVRPFAEANGEELLKLLDRHKRYIRGLVAPRVSMKFMPEIRFRIDTALDYAARIDALLNDPAVARDLKADRDEQE